ncbi:MAG: acyltransferase [Proteobacteria bacterium]|nr:acyltransferase [Pseudomonadota bacterium]MBU1389496.1 acyltransferase [Pseudomonadota bacterium]MBU1541316.1 acyltransferase [Pseudomonadota bacterium]MBU2481730.1 acyltransferase [Pseudomonadota bacterium]
MIHLLERIRFWLNEDRLGPDMLLTHIISYFPKYYNKICQKKFMHFGKNSNIRPGAYVIYCSTVSIGDNVVIRDGSMISGDSAQEPIIIEDDVQLGPGVHIYSLNHNFQNPGKLIIEQGYTRKKVIIKKGAWIGANSIILPGVTIGEHAVVGAGSVVAKDIEGFTVAAGNPAKHIKRIDGNSKQ